jgi:hypothetical protein
VPQVNIPRRFLGCREAVADMLEINSVSPARVGFALNLSHARRPVDVLVNPPNATGGKPAVTLP